MKTLSITIKYLIISILAQDVYGECHYADCRSGWSAIQFIMFTVSMLSAMLVVVHAGSKLSSLCSVSLC
jgi:hypothetical protein